MTGHDAGHRALEAQLHALLARRLPQLLAVMGEQLLVGGDDVPAGAHRGQQVLARRLEAADQLDDQVRALEDLVERAPRLRVSTPDSSGRSPVIRSIRSACAGSSSANAGADRAVAEQPDAERLARGPPAHRRDVPAHQVGVGLAAHDEARVAVAAEDHRRARHAVVVVGHRVAVGAGGRA